MFVTVCSIFRDSEAYLPRYFSQIAGLREHVNVRLVLGEGDSTDHTARVLPTFISEQDRIITCDHGGPAYGSVDNPQRWADIAQVVQQVKARAWPPGDAFVWVESDLIWQAESMVELLKADRCVAAMVFADTTMRFYDYWGYRKNGEHFDPQPPYIPHGGDVTDRYVKIDSCGSCFVVPGEDFDVVEQWDGVWPFPAGGRLWLDREAEVRHP